MTIFGSFMGRVTGIGAAIANAVGFIINLMKATNSSATDATVLAVPVNGLAADPLQIITIPAGYPRMQGARWVDTVAGGAALGSEELANNSFDNGLTDWSFSNWTAAPGAAQHTVGFTNSLFQGVLTLGLTFELTFTVSGRTAGSATQKCGNASIGAAQTTNGTFTETLVCSGNTNYLITPTTDFDGMVEFTSVKQVIPHWSAVDAAGASLTNATDVDDAGTNKITAVKANPTDTTNVALESGDGSLAIASVSSNLDLSGLGEVCNGNVYRMSGGTSGSLFNLQAATGNTNLHSVSAYVALVSGVGVNNMQLGPAGLIIMSLSPLFTLQKSEGITPTSAANVLKFLVAANTVIDVILPQLEESAVSTSVIIGADTAASASRDADVNTVATPSNLSAASGAIEMVVDPANGGVGGTVWSMQVDADNYTALLPSTTTVIFRKRLLGVGYNAIFTYTTVTDTPFRVQVYWDAVLGVGCRVADATADISIVSFATNANTADSVLTPTLSIGHRDGASLFVGEYANNGLPKTWASAEDARWL